jgi:glycosyltransferase involved in cell wall biosynthesis
MKIALAASGHLISKKEATWLTMWQLAQEYQKRGHETIIIAQKHQQLPEIEEVNGVRVYRMFPDKINGLNRFFTVRKTLAKLGSVDVLHSFSSSPIAVLDSWIARKYARKRVHTIKSYPKQGSGKFTRLLNLADEVTVSTEIVQKKLKGCKSSIIRSNIDLSKFKPRDKDELKKKYGYSGKKVVLYYGAMREQKGVDYLIKAIPALIAKYPDAFFIFAGRSKEASVGRYSKMIEELQCSEKAKIIVDDICIEEYVSMADVVVLAYPNIIGTEGNPSCLLESMAAGTPVVTTALPELQEIVGEEVFMAIPGDVNSLVVEICRIFDDPELRERLVERGVLKAQEFGAEKISEEFLGLYSS